MTGPAQPGGGPPAQQPWPAYPAPSRRETNGLAIASLILGVIWLFWLGSLLAVVLGAVALRQVRRTGDSGRGFAIAGITLGIVGFVFLATLTALILAERQPALTQPALTQPALTQPALTQPAPASLPSCAPAPCADYQGFVLRVTAVDPDFHPGPGGADTPGPGFHIVRVTITLDDVTGEHGYDMGFDLSLVDATGAVQDNGLGTAYGAGCPEFLPGAQDMAPGGHAGPFTICYPAGGPPSGPLALAWTPDVNMTGCTSPADVAGKPTGELVNTGGCDAVLISLQH